LLRSKTVEHSADEIIFGNSPAGSLANGFLDLFVHDRYLLEQHGVSHDVIRTQGLVAPNARCLRLDRNAIDVPRGGMRSPDSVVNPDTVRTCWFTNIFVDGLHLFVSCSVAATSAAVAWFFTTAAWGNGLKPGWNHRQLSQSGHPRLHGHLHALACWHAS